MKNLIILLLLKIIRLKSDFKKIIKNHKQRFDYNKLFFIIDIIKEKSIFEIIINFVKDFDFEEIQFSTQKND